ncbi:efflux RND transporter permease subunit [Beggiatoa alba]|nr:efflux RND transporter permease subunit [Beggiatoa alba]
MKKRFRSGGLAAWSIQHPIGISMLALTVVVVGFFSLERLGVDLLPHIIYPEIRVSVRDPGVPSRIMEDQVTRQIEEQLAITEGAIAVQSTSSEGSSRIALSFPYGTDIDIALRDASTRLDRAKRFLPNSIDPPVIYKRDPSQIPVLELAVSSSLRSPVKLREWVDYNFSRWFINLPGVAAAEVGGGNIREIQIIVDQERLAHFGLTLGELKNKIQINNLESPAGRLNTASQELSTRTMGRFKTIEEIRNLPLSSITSQSKTSLRLSDLAQVIDTHEDERLRIRLNDNAAIKLSLQKQPKANTVAVVDAVNKQLQWLVAQKLVPDDIDITPISDQSTFVRYAIKNASIAVLSGATLAMLVVYLFLGSLKRTLIIGSAIPLAILFTFIIMSASGLTLNIMTLGALALGVGLLIDSTIIMLENITRHQQLGEQLEDASLHAAQEINSAIVASTSTNLAAILPFLFISGLTGLLFSELVFVLSIAILASLIVAITLVPSLGAQIKNRPDTDAAKTKNNLNTKLQLKVSRGVTILSCILRNKLEKVLAKPSTVFYIAIPLLIISIMQISSAKYKFLPSIDEGQVRAYIKADTGVPFGEFDKVTRKLEALFKQQADVETVFTTSGGFVFGRSEFKSSNSGSIFIQLKSATDSAKWINNMRRHISKLQLVGTRVFMRTRGVRGIRSSRGDDDLSLRVQGSDINQLAQIGDSMVKKLKGIKGLRNITHTYEDVREEIVINVNRQRAADLAINVDDINQALRIALEGELISEYLDGDKRFNIRLRLPRNSITTPNKIKTVIVGLLNGSPIRLGDVSNIQLLHSPSKIKRDRQRRIVEISGSFVANADLSAINSEIDKRLENLKLPLGYTLYDAGSTSTLQDNQQSNLILIALALFLVFVVMAVQYESLVNPLVIIISMLFTVIGVTFGIWLSEVLSWLIQIPFDFSKLMPWLSGIPVKIQTSMPFRLGLIMLIGIVVNNAIVLVEQIEIEREKGIAINDAILNAAQLRLRPILMTTLTTVVGMLPLAIGIGNGSELLQPLAIVIVWGLLFSSLISLVLVPAIYKLFHSGVLSSKSWA